jgi:hypothetical protein
MAVQISNGGGVPHATDYSDLLSKLKTFALLHGWTSLEDTSDKLVLKGSGSGTDEIVVAFQKYANATTGAYGWRLNGYAAYDSGDSFLDQPGAIQLSQSGGAGYPALPLWNTTIPYWFVVSPFRIIVVAKVSTTYQMAYLGWCLPFASPNQYPYPLCVGGSYQCQPGANEPLYSGANGLASNFWTTNSSGLSTSAGQLWTRLPGGAWSSQQNGLAPSTGLFPYNQADIGLMRNAVDGDAVLSAIEIHQNSTVPVSHHRLGEFDGVYHVSGFGQSAENIITISAVDYLVTPNVFRSGVADFCAVKLA